MFKKIRITAHQFIRDKEGRVRLGQFPNAPIVGWFVCMVIAGLISVASFKKGFSHLSLAFLSIWSYLEITRGVSSFRRMLGGIIAVIIIFTFFR